MIFQHFWIKFVALHRPLVVLFALLVGLSAADAQQNSQAAAAYERTYSQSKSEVEKTLKELQPSLSGRLPALDGFAVEGSHPLSHYQRGYYQSSVHLSPAPAGGTVVRVTSKVTAWYPDPSPSRSGYQLLPSNGRLESDLLDQLTELLATGSNATSRSAREASSAARPAGPESRQTAAGNTKTGVRKSEPVSAPVPRSPEAEKTFASSPPPTGLSSQQLAETKGVQGKSPDRAVNSLRAEADSLEEILKNQAHPKNLVAVKKSGTPVVSTPSLSGKTLFLASAQDEFEMLDFNSNWVHVRISGLSRGWIWRTSLEMPEGISDVPKTASSGAATVADLFQVAREEKGPFPGDWEPLRGKKVKIISVQKIQENEKDSGAQAKLEYAKSLIDKNYAELAAESRDLAGIVLIFDSVDGGMIAATMSTVQAWKAGTLSDAALWHQCYFDPPETFTVSSNPASGH
jgi:hypothetical protein